MIINTQRKRNLCTSVHTSVTSVVKLVLQLGNFVSARHLTTEVTEVFTEVHRGFASSRSEVIFRDQTLKSMAKQ